jgi:hypothetical protein
MTEFSKIYFVLLGTYDTDCICYDTQSYSYFSQNASFHYLVLNLVDKPCAKMQMAKKNTVLSEG